MLNSTLAATERTLCAILENYQTEKGIEVPDVLKPYMGDKTFIPFTEPAPIIKEEKSKKQQQQKGKGKQQQQQKGKEAEKKEEKEEKGKETTDKDT